MQFQSTPSYEGELSKLYSTSRRNHFNPLPHTRENYKNKYKGSKLSEFQSTPSYEGERKRSLQWQRIRSIFQSTPSYEGEQANGLMERMMWSDFNPLPHTRENYKKAAEKLKKSIFQSTPSYEGEQLSENQKTIISQFQSTPSYEGEQFCGVELSDDWKISIHSLIRGRTCLNV